MKGEALVFTGRDLGLASTTSATPYVVWSEFLATQRRCIVFPVKYELDLYILCRRK
jgi:hypothetical protein